MRVALPIHGGRLSPVLDVARHFVLVDVGRDKETARCHARIATTDLVVRVKRLVALGAHVLICGAISRPLEKLLVSAGVNVISNRCGSVDKVIAAFTAGELTEQAFLMPGCTSRRR